LVHWLLTDGYIWYSKKGPGRAAAPPSPLLVVPNVTAHPSTASVQTSLLLTYLLTIPCGTKLPLHSKELTLEIKFLAKTFGRGTGRGLLRLAPPVGYKFNVKNVNIIIFFRQEHGQRGQTFTRVVEVPWSSRQCRRRDFAPLRLNDLWWRWSTVAMLRVSWDHLFDRRKTVFHWCSCSDEKFTDERALGVIALRRWVKWA